MTRRRETITEDFVCFLLPFLLVFVIACCGEQDAGKSDRSALLRFKSSVSDKAGVLKAWSAVETDHCLWPWVSCDSNFRVTVLNFSAAATSCPLTSPSVRSCSDSEQKLTGPLPPVLGELRQLKVLFFPFNGFFGEIPGEIWLLENLEVLNFEGNILSDYLPLRFPRSLRVLNLAFNQFIGEIPHSLSNCLLLETLDLSGNDINGTFPGFLTNLPNLRVLHLSFNQLSGSIPEEIGSGCQNLEHLDLSGNLLIGSIPRTLGNCSNLQSLLLFSNLLDDILPSELGLLRKLQVLDISRNSLSGTLPPKLGNCTALSVLVLSNPYLPVQRENGDTSDVDVDDFNSFQYGIPDSITSLPFLRVLWAPRLMLEGDIPSNWGTCQSLEMVNLGENLLTGRIPKVFGQCGKLKFLNMSSNKLSGWISEVIPVPCMDVFDISGNQLSGPIPAFIGNTCHLSRPFTDNPLFEYASYFWYGTRAGLALNYLNLTDAGTPIYHNFARNNLTGSLQTLPVGANATGGQILYAFFVERNQLVGPLSENLFEKCNILKGLFANFSNNLIQGEIPEKNVSLCQFLKVLDASGNQITGTIPRSLGLSQGLLALDLSRNRLQGEIPVDFGNLKDLRFLSVAGNNLSGQIPSGLDQLYSLESMDLSSNRLVGAIPSGLVKLKNLSVLLLDSNKLSGMIPNMSSVPVFNVSYNNLSGPLPFNSSELRCDSFYGNPLLPPCPMLALSEPPSHQQGLVGDSQVYFGMPPGSPPTNSDNGFSSIEIASITSASAIVSVLLALVVLYIYTRKCATRESRQSSGQRVVNLFTEIGVPITYESVVRATGGFNASNCIGSGGFGATYKAEISPGVLVAIKRLSVGRLQGVQQFHAEIKTLGRWRHPNLVTLIGYHLSDDEMFLIYNYLPGGNLERFIQERSKRPVDWRMLHKIALDVARALAYLHDNCVPRILHRDVKPSNILLDNDHNAYLSDFGLARLLGNSETHATTGVAGTFGYVAPEYAMTCRVSDKADVYSYGVVLLELLSDKKALDPSFSPYGNGFNIVAWACMLLRQGRAREFFTEGLWDVGPHDDLIETLHLAVTCTVESLSIRPTMKQVVQRLKQLQLPTC